MTAPSLVSDLASYVPNLIVRRLTANPVPTTTPSAERLATAVLFADISGFTALTERLARRGPSGTEELTQLLNAYFGHLIEVVANHGGDVFKFAGDGLLALWPADEGLPMATLRAVQCGLAVQMTMTPGAWSVVDEDQEPPQPFKVRIGIGAGEVTLMRLGGVFGRWEMMVAGEPLLQVSLAQQQARPGEVVIAPAAWPLVEEQCVGLPVGKPVGAGIRLEALRDLVPLRPRLPLELHPNADVALRAFIPKAILSRLVAGQTGWLSELRRVTVLFVNLPDLTENLPLEQAQAALRAVQNVLYRYEGSISRLGGDDKGPTLVAALGLPPLSHEDDAARGVQAALAIHATLNEMGMRSAVGVTTGQAFCGAVGSLERREYTMMGVVVNLAARLMQAAPGAGAAILCDLATYQAAQGRLDFVALPPLQLKGIATPVPVFQPRPMATGTLPVVLAPLHPPTLIGRAAERSVLAAQLQRLVQQNAGRVIVVEGDAGIGKSRLVADLRQSAAAQGVAIWMGDGSAIEQLTPYHAWRSVFSQLLELDGLGDPEARRTQILRRLEGAPDRTQELPLHRLAPLLNTVLPIDAPENDLTAQMSGQVRAKNTRDLLLHLLGAATREAPRLLIVEDAQWIDSASWALILAVSQLVVPSDGDGLPLLMVIAIRDIEDAAPPEYRHLLRLPGVLRLHLEGLAPADIQTLVSQRLGVAAIPAPLQTLVYARAQGNPFFSEELACALRDDGLISVSGGICRVEASSDDLKALRLPDTVQGVIIRRIDRLAPAQQLTLKVASVIGPVVTLRTLRAIHPVVADRDYQASYMATLQLAGLTLLVDSAPEPTYAFRHAIIRDVTYNLMSFAQRRELHRAVAGWHEQTYAEDLAPHYALLAYHWGKADVPARATAYLERAGEQALRSGAYQEAIDFLSQALDLDRTTTLPNNGKHNPAAVTQAPLPALTPAKLRQARWERQIGEACYGMGRLAESREHLERAVALLGYPVPTARQDLAGSLLGQTIQQCRYRLLRARPLRSTAPARAALLEAVRAYELLGQLYYYDNQLTPTLHAALRGVNLAEAAGAAPELAQAYASMQVATGLIALHPLSRLYGRLAQRQAHGDRTLTPQAWIFQASGIYHIGRGNWAAARTALEQALALTEQLGDHRRWAENRSLLAWITACQGDFHHAAQLCAELYAGARRSGDVQAQTWGLIGQVDSLLPLGRAEVALELLAEAESLLAENLDRARAEEIWAYALLALTALRRDERHLARHTAAAAVELMAQAPPTAIYALSGCAGVAEVYLTLWETRDYRSYVEGLALAEASRRVCATLNTFGRTFPVVRPRSRLWQGLCAWLAGRPAQARAHWRAGLIDAVQLAMPYDQGRLHFEMGRHALGAERRTHLAQAAALFSRLGATYDLGRVQAAQVE